MIQQAREFTTLLIVPLVLFLCATLPAEAKTQPLLIHIVSGSKEYDSEKSLKAFKSQLESSYDVSITASWGYDKIEKLPNLEPLKNADLLIVFARRMNLPPEQMKLFHAHWNEGKPVMGIRTASHAFQKEDNAVFDLEVLGGHYNGHYGDEPVKVTNETEQSNHPVLQGVPAFPSQKLYKAGPLHQNSLVLQIGDNGKGVEPVTIVHNYKNGRMFYTALGTPNDFEHPAFQTLLTNAVFWTTQRNPSDFKK